ncbi:MAG: valine--tRNA ligase, partial [Candidatus Eisenbacteria bacterium]|nr:valine--tRNA ligase [Candidatus Eisenbacteria bacterium]
MSKPELPKAYEAKDHETRIYAEWEKDKEFRATVNPDREPYTIMIPPPNVTGVLHMGHVLDNALQDSMIRFRRMQGREALWQPGTDHAGIATQNVVEKALRAEGKTRHDLGREKFVEKAWAWKEEKGGHILQQLRRLGSSPDWDRTRFTMEPDLSKAVTEAFIRLHKKGLVYRGNYIVNWCPRCMTALSDEEVEHTDEQSSLWHIRYPLSDGSGHVTVATTRPETMLGDTAIAIHPDSEKTAHLKGKTVRLPFLDREIPIVEDDYVDAEFGAGALKVTPAHDPNDFEIGKRHNLPAINVMNKDATISEEGGPFAGMDRYDARKKVVAELEEMGLLEKIEDHPNAMGRCHRCNTVVEPTLSMQWFVKMQPLADPALKAYHDGDVKFIPEHWGKTYTHWLGNIRDWVISRQLWWGHRIPVYYCDGCEHEMVAHEAPANCEKCQGTAITQDPDVLDTWFSSWLWPFSTLGWPEKTKDLEYFYPTQWLTTGPDIIFFWVARMIMAGLEFMGEVPFKEVYLHGIVRDGKGRKMSKSLGNSPEPIDIIDEYGADALRFTMIALTPTGQDVQFDAKKTELGRNFANKIWNASRLILSNLEGYTGQETMAEPTAADRWILSRLDRAISEVTKAFDESRFSEAAWYLYEFFWKEYCDWYLEFSKLRLRGEEGEEARSRAQHTTLEVLKTSLTLLHPLFPFMTEAVWENVPSTEGRLIAANWPDARGAVDEAAEREIEPVMEAISALRNMRGEMNVPPSTRLSIMVQTDTNTQALLEKGTGLLRTLARVDSIVMG